MLVRKTVLAALAATAALGAGTGAHAQEPSLFGVWRNPKDSVHVEIRPCAAGACGHVVWANAKARADAREGGTEDLVGLQLFRNFVQEKGGVWRGKVFVPDLNRTFSGTATLVDSQTLRARGCLVGNLVCKSQTWTRIRG